MFAALSIHSYFSCKLNAIFVFSCCCCCCWHNICTAPQTSLFRADDTIYSFALALSSPFRGCTCAIVSVCVCVGGGWLRVCAIHDNCNRFTRMQKRRKFSIVCCCFWFFFILLVSFRTLFFFYDKFVCIHVSIFDASRWRGGWAPWEERELRFTHAPCIQSLELRVRLHASAVFTRLKLRPQVDECQRRQRQPAKQPVCERASDAERECVLWERAYTQRVCGERAQRATSLHSTKSESVLVLQQRQTERESMHMVVVFVARSRSAVRVSASVFCCCCLSVLALSGSPSFARSAQVFEWSERVLHCSKLRSSQYQTFKF